MLPAEDVALWQETCWAADDGAAVRITRTGRPPVVTITGDIDEYTYASLVERLAAVTAGLREIHVNLGGVTYCDIAGLRAILLLASAGDYRQPGTTRLVLHQMPPHLRTVLRILGWDSTPGLTLPEPGPGPAAGPRAAGQTAGGPPPDCR
jgi:anti-anti-sigma factor